MYILTLEYCSVKTVTPFSPHASHQKSFVQQVFLQSRIRLRSISLPYTSRMKNTQKAANQHYGE